MVVNLDLLEVVGQKQTYSPNHGLMMVITNGRKLKKYLNQNKSQAFLHKAVFLLSTWGGFSQLNVTSQATKN